MLFSGLDVPIFYDSLLGKLIVWAETRELAIERMKRALRELLISGPQTNIPFHLALMDNEDFRSGNIHTNWLEQSFVMPENTLSESELHMALAAAAISSSLTTNTGSGTQTQSKKASKWTSAGRGNSMEGLPISTGESGWLRGTR